MNQPWKLGRRPALDGVRGVAILLVMLAHLEVPGFSSGGVSGVTLFFVLSGFLITSLLTEELNATGRIDVRAFYRRRALRLLPALLTVTVVVAGYEVVAGRGSPLEVLEQVAGVVFYAGNWLLVSGGSLGFLGHTWSLAIEEQFYLLWPALLLLARPLARRTLFALVLAGAVASSVERAVLWHGWSSHHRVYYGTDVRADGLLLGAALALWLTSGRRLTVGRPTFVLGLLLLASATIIVRPWGAVFVIAPTLAAAGGLLLLAYLVAGERGRVFRWSFLRATGRISYGLYLWHLPIVWALLPKLHGLPLPVRVALCLGLAYAVAFASYRWVEQPFLRRKEHARRSRLVPVAAPA